MEYDAIEVAKAGLDRGQRLRYEAAVVSDYGLRTALASTLGAAMLATAARGGLRAAHRELGFDADLADAHDPDAVFDAPPEVEIESMPGRGLDLPGAHVDLLRFTSPYVARKSGGARRLCAL